MRMDMPPGPGRPKGSLNKATYAARSAIADFVDGNAHRLQEWLDMIASGKKPDGSDTGEKPNPVKAFELFQSVVEYHIPKLARTDIQALDKNGDKANGFKVTVEHVAARKD